MDILNLKTNIVNQHLEITKEINALSNHVQMVLWLRYWMKAQEF